MLARGCCWLFLLAPVPALGDVVLDQFPVVVRAGLAGDPSGEEVGGRVLPDLPFSPEHGYGYVGGHPGRWMKAALAGGEPSWLPAWRQGVEKYLFRVPNGEYLVELTFLETEVAAPGLRAFDVIAEEKPLFTSVDIARLAGDFTWLTLRGAVSVLDGWLDIRFVTSTAERPPRVSRIRLVAAAAPVPPPAAPVVQAHGGPGFIALSWSIPDSTWVVGYGVFRSDSAEGPYEPLQEEPARLPWIRDWSAVPGRGYHYRACAYDARGRQGPVSSPVTATAREIPSLGLKVYELEVSQDGLRAISALREPAGTCTGLLRYLGVPYHVVLSHDPRHLGRGGGVGWGPKKDFWLELQPELNRTFGQRRCLYLSAAADDPSRMEEQVWAGVAAAVGLAGPAVEPIALVLNGRFHGLYFDIEVLGDEFRKRARLDLVGLLARRTRPDALERDWKPCGEQVGEVGNLMVLTDFLHQLNCLPDGEMGAFFEDSLYLERFLERAALTALAGETDRSSLLRFALRDSRNGKWELLQDRWWARKDPGPSEDSPRGAGKGDGGDLGAAEAEEWLFGDDLLRAGSADGGRLPDGRGEGSPGGPGLTVLETRFFGQGACKGRFLDRLESILSGPLAPDAFGSTVDSVFRGLRDAALEDAFLWPAVGSPAEVTGAPGVIQATYRARAAALRGAVVRHRAKGPVPLVINEFLSLPAEGEPWIEILNRSTVAVSLGGHAVAVLPRLGPPGGAGPDRIVPLPGRQLAPGETLVVRFPAADSPPGSCLVLHRAAPSRPSSAGGAPEVLDIAFLSHPTRGVSYGRRNGDAQPGGSQQWAYFSEPTRGLPNSDRAVEPPPYEYRQGIVPDERGGVTIWFRTRARAGVPDAGKPAKVWLRYRDEGATEFQSVELAWDETNFRFFAGLEANPERTRTAYYFVAASAAGVERAYPLPAPALTYFLPVNPGVKLNEVLPRPAREDGGSGEFIEIYNPSGGAVSLEGCFLSDTRRNTTRWRIPEGNTIPPRGFLVFYADGLNRENHTSFRLSNSGEFLGLYGRMEEGNLLLDSMAYRGMRMGESWGALPDGSRNFRVWKDPTPGAKNLPRIPEDRLGKDPQPEGEGSGEPAAPIDDSGQGRPPPGASGGELKPPLDPREDLPEDP